MMEQKFLKNIKIDERLKTLEKNVKIKKINIYRENKNDNFK